MSEEYVSPDASLVSTASLLSAAPCMSSGGGSDDNGTTTDSGSKENPYLAVCDGRVYSGSGTDVWFKVTFTGTSDVNLWLSHQYVQLTKHDSVLGGPSYSATAAYSLGNVDNLPCVCYGTNTYFFRVMTANGIRFSYRLSFKKRHDCASFRQLTSGKTGFIGIKWVEINGSGNGGGGEELFIRPHEKIWCMPGAFERAWTYIKNTDVLARNETNAAIEGIKLLLSEAAVELMVVSPFVTLLLITIEMLLEAGTPTTVDEIKQLLNNIVSSGKGAILSHQREYIKETYSLIGEWDLSTDNLEGPFGSAGEWEVFYE